MLTNIMSTLAAVQPKATRRGFMLSALALGTTFAIGYRALPVSKANAAEEAAVSPFQSYIEIAADGKSRSIRRSSRWGRCLFRHRHAGSTMNSMRNGPTSPSWVAQATRSCSATWPGVVLPRARVGSTSMASSWDRYRKAGAAGPHDADCGCRQVVERSGIGSYCHSRHADPCFRQERQLCEMAQAAAGLPVPADVPLSPGNSEPTSARPTSSVMIQRQRPMASSSSLSTSRCLAS